MLADLSALMKWLELLGRGIAPSPDETKTEYMLYEYIGDGSRCNIIMDLNYYNY
jgi:hypothetical protein